MADWGAIIGEGLIGGLIGGAEAKLDTIVNEEEEARKEGYARLKNEFEIEDREWDRRMKLEDQAHLEGLQAKEAADRERIAKDNRAHNEALAEKKAQRDEDYKKWLLGEKQSQSNAENAVKEQKATEKEKYGFRKDANKGYTDYKKEAFETGEDETKLMTKPQWVNENLGAKAFTALYGEKVKALGDAFDMAMDSENPDEKLQEVFKVAGKDMLWLVQAYGNEKYPDYKPGASAKKGEDSKGILGDLPRLEPSGRKKRPSKPFISVEPGSWADKAAGAFSGAVKKHSLTSELDSFENE